LNIYVLKIVSVVDVVLDVGLADVGLVVGLEN